MPDRISASQVSKHLNCAASANLPLAIEGYVPPLEDPSANNAANRGTKLHDFLAQVQELSVKDQKNFAAAVSYVAELRSKRRFTALIEHGETAAWLTTLPKTTADVVLYTQDEMHVIDWKTGTIPVSPVENDQLLYYAATYGKYAPKAKGVTLHIVQPWADVMEGWFASSQRIAQFMLDVQKAEARIQGGDVTFGPGDHCLFCPANPHGRGARGAPSCPPLVQLYYPRIETDEAAVLGLED
jgi:hypothetical protein